MPAKRTAESKSKTSVAKKAKVSKTPLDKNFEIVKRALTNEDFDVPCREMWVDIADKVLMVPKEERHGDQEAIIGMMNEIFAKERSRWEAREAEAKSAVDASSAEREEKVALRDAADAEVKAQRIEVTAKEEQQEKAIQVIKDCDEDLDQASISRSASEKKRSDLVKELEDVHAVQEIYKTLKEGTFENPKEFKKHLSAITSFFKSINVEEALLKTIPQVFQRKPEERGGFDEVALTQLESYTENHLNALASNIDVAGQTVEEHDVAVTAWGAALELAKDKKGECDDALRAAEAQQELLDGALKAARNVLKEHTALVKARNNDLLKQQVGLGETEEVQKALEFLQDYTIPPPQEDDVPPVPEEVTMEVQQPEEATLDAQQVTTQVTEMDLVIPVAKAKEIDVAMNFDDVPSPSKRARHSLGGATSMVVA